MGFSLQHRLLILNTIFVFILAVAVVMVSFGELGIPTAAGTFRPCKHQQSERDVAMAEAEAAVKSRESVIQALMVKIAEAENSSSHLPPAQSTELPTENWSTCLAVVIGDFTAGPSPQALPYLKVHSLLVKVRENLASWKSGGGAPVLKVFTDHGKIVCRMVLDEFGSLASCASYGALFVDSMQTRTACQKLFVGRSSLFVPQVSRDWLPYVAWNELEAVDLDEEPPVPEVAAPRRTILTAVSNNHAEVFLHFLRGLGKFVDPALGASVLVYDMGLQEKAARRTECLTKQLQEQHNLTVEVRRFDFSRYPSWMDVSQANRGEYAWKPIIIHEVLLERGSVLWLDSGDRATNRTMLTQIFERLDETGFVNRMTYDLVGTWVTHPLQREFLRASPEVLGKVNCDGSAVGFTLAKYREIMRPWYDCALARQCIAPVGSHRGNHRQDQAALSILVYASGHECTGVLSPQQGFLRQQDRAPDESLIVPSEC